METFIARAAQTAYNRAGFPRDEAFERAQQVAEYVIDNLPACQKLFRIDDEIELGYRVAQTLLTAGAA